MSRTTPAAPWLPALAFAAVALLAADGAPPISSSSGGLRPEAADVVARLSGTRWAVQLEPMYGEKPAQALVDVLRFQGDLVTSDRLASSGFQSGRYTVMVDADGESAWEATQVNLEEGIALWKGEFHAGTVRGIMSQHPLTGETLDFIFVGQEVASDSPATESPMTENPATEGAPTTP